jgi:metal-responsive CopG/Arc/MetJ family transcriptional regulator
MKIAISIPDDLFKEVDNYARDHKYSRSEVFALAVKDFFRKIESRKMLSDLNEVYAAGESAGEKTAGEKSKRYYARKAVREEY